MVYNKNINSYSLTYSNNHKLIVNKQGLQVGSLVADDFRLDGFTSSILKNVNIPHNVNTRQLIRCLEIKEKRLHFAQQNPLASGLLSVISVIGIAILALPWMICMSAASVDGSGPHSMGKGLLKSTQRTLNAIRPVFFKSSLQSSIDHDKQKLIHLVVKMEALLDQKYLDQLNLQHQKDLKNYGEVGWKKRRECTDLDEYRRHVQKIAKHVFGRDLV